MATWQNTQNKAFLETCLERMKGPTLTWVNQFLDILAPHLKPNTTLNDIGCNVGQFYKGLQERKIKFNYRGFDIEPLYLKEAQKFFPELKNKLFKIDIEKGIPPKADISVVSATLEHLEELSPGLDHILSSAKKICLVRTFLGEKSETKMMMKKNSKIAYPINQYAFEDIFKLFARYGFETTVLRDHYTDSMPKYIAIETIAGQGMVRTQYIIFGKKI